MNFTTPRRQAGAVLFVGLIVLLLITLMLVTAFNLSTSNVRAVGNMQFRDEALAAAEVAIDSFMASSFFTSYDPSQPRPSEEFLVDLDGDNVPDYVVVIPTPACVMATRASEAEASSLSLPLLNFESDWNTTWQVDATVTPHASNRSGASLKLREGIRVLLDQTAKTLSCGAEPL